jgi:hypothetical protein
MAAREDQTEAIVLDLFISSLFSSARSVGDTIVYDGSLVTPTI